MNKILLAELTKMEDVQFRLLEHHIHIARMIRDCMIRNAMDEKAMADVIQVEPKRMKEVLNGAYPFDLRLLSKLESFNQTTAANNAKIKVEAESIAFATYKDQYPMFVDRINKLLTILEDKTSNPDNG